KSLDVVLICTLSAVERSCLGMVRNAIEMKLIAAEYENVRLVFLQILQDRIPGGLVILRVMRVIDSASYLDFGGHSNSRWDLPRVTSHVVETFVLVKNHLHRGSVEVASVKREIPHGGFGLAVHEGYVSSAANKPTASANGFDGEWIEGFAALVLRGLTRVV